MENIKESSPMETHLEKPCDICGAVGFGELIIVCTKCGIACQHVYCMQLDDKEVPEVPEDWICEDCILDKDRRDGKENFHHDVEMQGGPAKAYDDSGQHSHSKRQKPIETGKVKFLSPEEVIRLSSGAAKKGSTKSNLGDRPGYSSVTPKFSPPRVKPNPRILSSGFMKPPGHGRIQFSSITSQQASRTPKDQKATTNPVKEHSCKVAFSPVKKSSCRDQKIASITSAKEFKISKADVLADAVKHCNANVIAKEVKTCNTNAEEAVNKSSGTSSTSVHHPLIIEERAVVAATEGHSCKEVNPIVPAKEVETVYMDTKNATKRASCTPPPSRLSPLTYGSGGDSCPVAESEKPDVEVRDSTNILPKLGLYRHYSPALRATWKGGFKFFDTTTPGKFYGGFQAQPPCRVNRKAYEFSKTMPTILQVNLLPRHHVWADLFQNDYPDFHDIALYFLPSPVIERSKENHACLFELLEIQNSVLRCYINDVELIIFTSKQLHTDLHDVIEMSSTRQFLWGVFRHGKSDTIPPEHDYASIECSDTVDMEIDMVGGQDTGRVDMIVTKELSERVSRESVKKPLNEDTLKMSNEKILNSFKDMDSTIQRLLLESEQAQRNLFSLYSEVARKITNDLASVQPLLSSVEKLSDVADVPPGFEELCRQKLNMLGKAEFKEEESHLSDVRVLSPVRKKTSDLQELTGDGYPQSCPVKVKTEAQKHEVDKQDFCHKSSIKSPSETHRLPCWSPPPTDWVKLNVAGSSKANPDVAGASGIIRDESGKWIVGYTLNLGIQTSMGAELWALFQGLLLAWDRGFRKVLVESQFSEAVEYLKRAPNALDPNRGLADCCMNLMKRNWDCQVLHIPREANLCANWLATRFQDYQLGLTVFKNPPGGLVSILQNDSMAIFSPPCRQS